MLGAGVIHSIYFISHEEEGGNEKITGSVAP